MTWIVAVSYPQREFAALRGLDERGQWAWLPTHEVDVKTRHMRKGVTRRYPLFPGYLLVRLAEMSGYPFGAPPVSRALGGIDAIRAVLCNDWRPLHVHDEEVAHLRAHLDDLAMPMIEDVLSIGDEVLVMKGALADCRGEVAEVRRRSAKVLFELLGGQRPVVVSLKDLRRAA